MGDSHSCRAAILTCIDFRFVESLGKFMGSEGLTGVADLIAWPGGAAALDTDDREAILATLELSHRLHSPQEVVLVVHEDCGRLGGSKAFPSAEAELETLEAKLASGAVAVADALPGLRVRLVRFDLSGEWQSAPSQV